MGLLKKNKKNKQKEQTTMTYKELTVVPQSSLILKVGTQIPV